MLGLVTIDRPLPHFGSNPRRHRRHLGGIEVGKQDLDAASVELDIAVDEDDDLDLIRDNVAQRGDAGVAGSARSTVRLVAYDRDAIDRNRTRRRIVDDHHGSIRTSSTDRRDGPRRAGLIVEHRNDEPDPQQGPGAGAALINDRVQQACVDESLSERDRGGRVVGRVARCPGVKQLQARRGQTEQAKWGAPEECGTVGAAASVGIKYPSLPLFRHEPNVRGNLMDPKTDPQNTDAAASQVTDEALVEEELLVEEISIDGMCGVY